MKRVLAAAILCTFLVACSENAPAQATSQGTIVAKVWQAQIVGDSVWQNFRNAPGVTALQAENADHSRLLYRFLLTVRDPAGTPANYDVAVSSACFDAVSVGGRWPSADPACR